MALETLLGLAVGKKMLKTSPYKGLSKKEIEKENIREELTGKKPTEERIQALKEKGTLKQRQKAEIKEAFKDSSKVTKALSKTPFVGGAIKTAKGVPRSTRGVGLALGGVAALNYFAPSLLRMVQNPAMFNTGQDLAKMYDEYYAPYSGAVEYSSLLGLRYLDAAKESGKNVLTKEVQAELKAEEQATKEYRIKRLMEGIESSGGRTSKEFLGSLSPEVFSTLEKEHLPKALEEPIREIPKVSKFKTPFSFLKNATKIGGRVLPLAGSAINVSMAKEYEKIGDVVGAKLRYAQAATSAAEATPAAELALPASLALEATDDLLNYMSGNDVRKKEFIASALTGSVDASWANVMGLPELPKGASFKPIYSKAINPETKEPYKLKKRITPFGSARLQMKDSDVKNISKQLQDENAPVSKPEFGTYDLFQMPSESKKPEKKDLKEIEFKPKGEIPTIEPKPISYQPSIFRAEKPAVQITDANNGNELFKKTISFDTGSKESFNERMISSLKDSLVSVIKETQSRSAIIDNSVSISGGGSGASDYYTSSQRGDPINHMRSDLRYKLNKIV